MLKEHKLKMVLTRAHLRTCQKIRYEKKVNY